MVLLVLCEELDGLFGVGLVVAASSLRLVGLLLFLVLLVGPSLVLLLLAQVVQQRGRRDLVFGLFLGKSLVEGKRFGDRLGLALEEGDKFRILVDGTLATVVALLRGRDALVGSKGQRRQELLELRILVRASRIVKRELQEVSLKGLDVLLVGQVKVCAGLQGRLSRSLDLSTSVFQPVDLVAGPFPVVAESAEELILGEGGRQSAHEEFQAGSVLGLVVLLAGMLVLRLTR